MSTPEFPITLSYTELIQLITGNSSSFTTPWRVGDSTVNHTRWGFVRCTKLAQAGPTDRHSPLGAYRLEACPPMFSRSEARNA